MPQFFINRPIFAWVIASITLAGVICLRELGIESYPQIAPPQVVASATFAGASADTVEKTVTQVIEQQLNGIDHLLYFSSVVELLGRLDPSRSPLTPAPIPTSPRCRRRTACHSHRRDCQRK